MKTMSNLVTKSSLLASYLFIFLFINAINYSIGNDGTYFKNTIFILKNAFLNYFKLITFLSILRNRMSTTRSRTWTQLYFKIEFNISTRKV